MTAPAREEAPVYPARAPTTVPTANTATPHGEVGSFPTTEPTRHPERPAATGLRWQLEASMSRNPSGVANTNRALPNSPQWGRLEHGQAHQELSLLSLREVIVELAHIEDALRAHRPLSDGLADPAKVSQLRHLRARQRVILHDLRRRARRRARLRPGTNEPSGPGPHPALGTVDPR
jgi:hypothetical protein